MWERWSIRSSNECLFASIDGELRRIRDKGGGVESRKAFVENLRDSRRAT